MAGIFVTRHAKERYGYWAAVHGYETVNSQEEILKLFKEAEKVRKPTKGRIAKVIIKEGEEYNPDVIYRKGRWFFSTFWSVKRRQTVIKIVMYGCTIGGSRRGRQKQEK